MMNLIEEARSRRVNALAALESHGNGGTATASGRRSARLSNKGADLIAKAREGRLNALKALESRCDNIFSEIFAEGAMDTAPARISAIPARAASVRQAQPATLSQAA